MVECDDLEILDNFDWYYKGLFIWKEKSYYKRKRIVFFGEKIEEPKFTVVLKKIKVHNNFKEILKEIYFLVCCQKSKYFIRLVDIFLSKDKNYIFLILKDEGANLLEVIDYAENNQEDFDYTKIDDMIKWIIFQIICGLYILHKNNLIHHDIKPGNILISSNGTVKIADFGSLDKSGTSGFGTIFYESPEFLLTHKGNEKDDMWAVGVIMVELYKKNYPFFNLENNKKRDKMLQLKSIMSRYKININNNELNINNKDDFNFIKEIIQNNSFEKYNFKEELNTIHEINDQEALDLVNNLLKINPEKRFTAGEALNSAYLSKFKNNFEFKNITYIIKDYESLLENVNSKDIFVKNVETIKQKYLGEVLFE